MGDKGKVVFVEEDSQFQHLIEDTQLNPNLILVCDFFAEWCGACQSSWKQFVELSKKYIEVKFVRVDVQLLDDLATSETIRAIPTYVIYKNGRRVSEMIGGDMEKLDSLIQTSFHIALPRDSQDEP